MWLSWYFSLELIALAAYLDFAKSAAAPALTSPAALGTGQCVLGRVHIPCCVSGAVTR